MIENIIISGFADEIDPQLDVQLKVVKELGMDHICLRAADGKGIAEYLPFLSDGALMHIFRQRIQRKQSVTTLLPFLPASAIDQLASSFTGE